MIKILRPHLFNKNIPILETIRSNNNNAIALIKGIKNENACAGIINIIKNIAIERRSIIIAVIPTSHKLIGFFIFLPIFSLFHLLYVGGDGYV